MAQADETRSRLKEILAKQNRTKEAVMNLTAKWYVQPSRFNPRVGNSFEIYYSGQEVFKALAKSIETAKSSIDIMTMGFDPAFPMVREDKIYGKTFALEEQGFFDWVTGKDKPKPVEVDRDRLTKAQRDAYHSGKLRLFSGWQSEDAYGEYLLRALRANEDLKVRIVLWWSSANRFMDAIPFMEGVQTSTGLGPWPADIRIPRTQMATGFDELPKKDHVSKELLFRDRHPDAQAYSKEWFWRLLYEQDQKYEDSDDKNPFNRIGVVFRAIGHPLWPEEIADEDKLHGLEKPAIFLGNTDHQKTVLIDIDESVLGQNAHAYVMGHNSTTAYWSAFPFEHRDPRNEMDSRPFHDFSMQVKGPLISDLSVNFCNAWEKNRKGILTVDRLESSSRSDLQQLEKKISPNKLRWIPSPLGILDPTDVAKKYVECHKSKLLDEEDGSEKNGKVTLLKKREKTHKELLTISAGSSEGQIVRTRIDEKSDGMPEKEIRDAYLQATQQARNYLFVVNQYLQYPLLWRHVKYWWLQYKDNTQILGKVPFPKDRNLYIFMGTARMELSAAVWRAHQMANELGCGDQFPEADKNMYVTESEAKEELAKFQSDGSTIIQTLEEIRIRKEQKAIKDHREARRQEQIAADQALVEAQKTQPNASDQPLPEPPPPVKVEESDKIRSQTGSAMGAAMYVSKAEIEEYQIKPLFFMFYTKIKNEEDRDENCAEDKVAQQPYVHAKLFVQDDGFFTMGSANLNVRSMAADSELNLISGDKDIAQSIRKKLWSDYTGYPKEVIKSEKQRCHDLLEEYSDENEQAIRYKFPNESPILSQEELGRIHKTFKEVMELNFGRIYKAEVIQGCISNFNEHRSGLDTRKA